MACTAAALAAASCAEAAACCPAPFARQDVLETHLAGEPGTPQEEVGAVHDDDRVLVPKRVALQVGRKHGAPGPLHAGK